MKPIQIQKIHLFLLGIVILNSVSKETMEIGLINWLDNILKLIVLLSGLWLFYKKKKTFRKITYYFSIYPISIVIGTIALIFRGIFGAIILSIILYPFDLNQAQYNRDNIRIYNEAKGFLSACCNYKLVETKFLVFEKILGRIKNDGPIDFEESKLNRLSHGIELVFQKEEFDEKTKSFELIEKKIRIEN